ncbi:hypothetical protein [Curtobacterium sp. Leaf261]|uniref:hypothetical protein n=1 Tax=Curtobacterium sp. Leaf261 TaxID=1736311 RepID=UPI0006F5C068|nr:hypothetical protein [Curtobacterium sp. Leaf261]KQO62283.1 hypothetical protein ASF23_10770 [Curtobacterium sp. Leaf261]
MSSRAEDIPLSRTSSSTRAEARALQRLAQTGTLSRIRPGVFADTAAVAGLDLRGRHVLAIRAALPKTPSTSMLSHLSAVALYGWPHIGAWPSRVHAVDTAASREIHRDAVTLHRSLDGPVEPATHVFEGRMVLPPTATAVETARTVPFSQALVILDHVLRSGITTLDRLVERVAWSSARGRGTAELAVLRASGRRESVGESFAAARMIEIGAPRFEEQHEFRSADGTVDRVDFWLPEFGVVVEFDGRQKYVDPAMRHGRSGADVLWDEKRREDRLRAHPDVCGVIRVRWWHLVDPDRLRALFREHGVPVTR